MADSYLGEIRLFAGTYAPVGWLICQGQKLPIVGNEALYSLLGTTYGGDGRSTFGIPNLCGRVPVHMGQGPALTNRILGSTGGSDVATVDASSMPTHTHLFTATANPASIQQMVADTYYATPTFTSSANGLYVNSTAQSLSAKVMAPGVLSNAGGGQPHENRMPVLGLNFIISLQGEYPIRP